MNRLLNVKNSLRKFGRTAGRIALGGMLNVCPLMAGEAEKPNIVFIFADDWGYGDVGNHGSTFCQTPNLDAMAAAGTDYANFTVNSPVCSPSRVAVMTGLFPARFCIHQHFQGTKAHVKRGMPDWLDPSGPMLPRLLKEAGYKTGHFGKWHLGRAADAPTEDQYGYDRFATFNGSGKNEIPKKGLASVDHAEAFIREFHEGPFFVNLWLHESHLAHYPRKKYLEKFKNLDERKRVYASVIAEGDEGVGRILKLLEELGIERETLVVFSSDNGPEFTRDESHKFHGEDESGGLGGYYSVGETGGLKGRKRSLFSGGVRVPFIVRWPGVVPEGRTDRASVLTAVDLLPTFLEVADVDLPEGYEPDGESALAAFKGGEFRRTKPIFWEWRGGDRQDFTWPSLGVRDGKWKLLVNPKTGKRQLFDLENDRAETRDVLAEHPEVAERLGEKLAAWKKSLPLKPDASALSASRAKKAGTKKTEVSGSCG